LGEIQNIKLRGAACLFIKQFANRPSLNITESSERHTYIIFKYFFDGASAIKYFGTSATVDGIS